MPWALVLLGWVPLWAAAQEPAAEGPPTWRFTAGTRRVKVVVLGGSISAWMDHPYAARLQEMCRNVEVRNISRARLGAPALLERLGDQVLRNRRLTLRDPALEHWLVLHGGLNSVANPERTNEYVRQMVVAAHQRGVRVVALSLTPWGDEHDPRWRGIAGLRYFRATRKVVDFVMGRLSPRLALGPLGVEREGGHLETWRPDERPDVAVDLYDSVLRSREARRRDVAPLRRALARDPYWQRVHERLPADMREALAATDADLAAEIPRWYLRQELRAFDHIHLNREGHRLIAALACPRLPPSWGCACQDGT